MRFHYDNSAANIRNPNHPPRFVANGNQTTDEMGHLWLELLPRGPGDRRLELQQAVMRHRIEKYPGDFAACFNLGALAMARLDVSGAVAMLERAVRTDDSRPDAHNMLGAALARVGRVPEAIAELRRALEERPDFANARLNLASALLRAAQIGEALADYREVLEEVPEDRSAREAVAAGARQMEDRGFLKEAADLERALSHP
jgi:tetratricopeptide (TPR) repeat protein